MLFRSDAPIQFSLDELSWDGADASLLHPLFDQLEFRSLKERVKVVATVAQDESSDELSLFNVDISSAELSVAQLEKEIQSHQGAIAITYEISDDNLQRYAVAISANKSFLVQGSRLGAWAKDPSIAKIAHDAKSLARISDFQGLSFDTELAAYLINPGVRAQEIGRAHV